MDRLEKWDDGAPHQVQLIPCTRTYWGDKWLEISFAEKDLGILVDAKVNMSQQ